MNFENKKIIKGVLTTLIIVFGGWFIFSLIGFYKTKKKYFAILSYESYTVGKYLERETRAKGATIARYNFEINGHEYENTMTPATFSNSKPFVGNYYFVVYNYYEPEESTIFFNLEVPDSLEYLYGENFKKIPIQKYQQKADSFMLKNIDGSVERYFPPYYSKEKIKQLLKK